MPLLPGGGTASAPAFAEEAVRGDVVEFFEARNAIDESTNPYRAGSTNWIIQTERYRRSFPGGVSANF